MVACWCHILLCYSTDAVVFCAGEKNGVLNSWNKWKRPDSLGWNSGLCSLRLLEELYSADTSRATKSVWCLQMKGANTLQWFWSLIITLPPYWHFLLNAIIILAEISVFCLCVFCFLRSRVINSSDLIQTAGVCLGEKPNGCMILGSAVWAKYCAGM